MKDKNVLDIFNYLGLPWRESCFLYALHPHPVQLLLNPKTPFPNALLPLLRYQSTVPSSKTERFPFATLSAAPPSPSPSTKPPLSENPTTPYPLCPKLTRPAASAAPEPPENSHCKTSSSTLFTFQCSRFVLVIRILSLLRRSIIYAACLEGLDPVRLFERRLNARRGNSSTSFVF